jgi:hypothetical protein
MVTTHIRLKCDGAPAGGNREHVPCSQGTDIDGTADVSYDGRLTPRLPANWANVSGHLLCDVCNGKFQSERFSL